MVFRTLVLQILSFKFLLLMIVEMSDTLLASDNLPSELVLRNEVENYKLNGQFEYYNDADDKLTLKEIISDEYVDKFKIINSFRHGLRHTKGSVWIRMNLTNLSDINKWFISFSSLDLAQVEAYIYDNNHLVNSEHYGLLVSEEKKTIFKSHAAIALTIEKKQSLTVFIKAKSFYLLSLNFNVLSEKKFEQYTLFLYLHYGLAYGVMLCLIIYNLFLYFILKDKAYSYYVVFILSVLLLIAIFTGHLDYFLRDLYGFLLYRYLDLFRAFPPVFAVLFAREFLRTKDDLPLWDKLMVSALWLSPLHIFYAIFYNESSQLGDFSNLIAILLIGVAAVKKLRLGFEPAKYYLVSWAVLAVSVIVWSLGKSNIIENTAFTRNAVILGNSFQLVLMSLALAQRIKNLEKARVIASIKERENERLHRLVRILCHDIANPLLVITGTLDFAIGSNKDKGLEKYLNMIKKASKTLEAIIQHTRKIEKISSGKLHLDLVPVSLVGVLNEATFIFQAHLRHKGITLTRRLKGEEKDLFVLADRVTLLHDVISNLISNAVKFSEPGSKIVVSAIPKGKVIDIEVVDEGIGMPESLLERVFDQTASTSRPGTNNEKGTGYGMPLVKSLVEQYGGNISIDSWEKKEGVQKSGTKVHISLKRVVS